MILVDTPIWIDHLRAHDHVLNGVLMNGMALAHPFVIGEIAMGSLARRAEVLAWLQRLPVAVKA